MEGTLPESLKELLVILMALFNLVLWGPIGFTVRRMLSEYDQHKELNNKLLQALKDELEALEQKHNDLRAELPEKYVSNTRFDMHMNRVEEMFRLILNKLESKADK